MTATAYKEKVDEAGGVLDMILAYLDGEEREHLALDLLDATRGNAGYKEILATWAIVALMRQRDEYHLQLKEWGNLESSGELFAGTPLQGQREPALM